jgi:ribonucleoside-diphosphate reductase alpha chain
VRINVLKRSGELEPLDIKKIENVLSWAAEGLDVSVSEVALKAHIQLTDGISTDTIHELLIKSAADLISAQEPDYQYMASKLVMMALRKRIYNSNNPDYFTNVVKSNVGLGKYDPEILELYSVEELNELADYIDYDRDFLFSYAATIQLLTKYLVQDRVTGQHYETPQAAYMMIAATLFGKYPKATRMAYVKSFYDAVSLHKISLPTPIMGGLRTPTRQFSSCVLIEADDSLKSINATAAAIINYISQKAGIGLNVGRIRTEGSKIRNGDARHTGVIPFMKHFHSAVKSCSQGAIRGGSATMFYPLWRLDIMDLLVLKNNRGTEETRIRGSDYGVQLNKLMYQRLITDGVITLFSPSDVPGLYDAFFQDQDEFERLYVQYENDKTIRKNVVKASTLFATLMQERAQTGRIYIQNVDHCNNNSAFIAEVAPIRQSNLCMEITLPTNPMGTENEEIALCTLAAINLGAISELAELEHLSNLLVRGLDALLDYQDYPEEAALKAKSRRSLGIGVTNFAYYLAKNGVYYSNGSANNLVHRTMEALQYYLLKASNELAFEVGACEYYSHTSYSKGILPIDRYKKDVDTIHTQELLLDWELLRRNIAAYGLRNSTVTSQMPCETSSAVTNSTNGIEPPRGLVSVKASKSGAYNQVVPDVGNVHYELLWDIPDNTGYLEIVAIMQKFIDQSISANTNYDPSKFDAGKVSMNVLLQDLITAYKLGIKTLYYHNTRDGNNQDSDDDGCAGGACKL